MQSKQSCNSESKEQVEPHPKAFFQIDNMNAQKGRNQPTIVDSEKIICVAGNKGAFYCAQSLCKNHAVFCSNQECICNKNHYECSACHKIDAYHRKLEKKIQTPSIESQIDTVILKIEDIISEMRNKLFKEAKLFGLSKLDKQFKELLNVDYEIIKNEKSKNQIKILGSFIKEHSVELATMTKEQMEQQKQNLIKIVSGSFTELNEKMNDLLSAIIGECQRFIGENDSRQKKHFDYFVVQNKQVKENISQKQIQVDQQDEDEGMDGLFD